MNIRSITYFCNPGRPLDEGVLEKAGEFMAQARPAFEAAGYTVQFARMATVPFQQLVPSLEAAEVIRLAQRLEAAVQARGYGHLSLGPALPEALESYSLIPEILAATEIVFLSGLMTTTGGGISLPAVRACAEAIRRIVPLDPNGFANLRFGATANVPPDGPFLPAAYHAGTQPAFALAIEAADLAVEVFTQADSLEEARRELIARMESHAHALTQVSEGLERRFRTAFAGIDFTLAPFPEEPRSLGAALEHLGVPAVGLHGSLAAAAFLMDTTDRANYRRAGFNGLMLPVLEDAVLAQRAGEGTLTVKDLLLYAAVCGTGLDTVPLPGDISTDQIAAILLDVAALAQRLDKPLIARLMPVPNKKAGDPTTFDFPFFANSRVLAVQAEPLQGKLAGEEVFHLERRRTIDDRRRTTDDEGRTTKDEGQ